MTDSTATRIGGEGHAETPKTVVILLMSIFTLILFWIGAENTLEMLPRGIAAVMSPEGFAVQMLIDGIKQ
jgi:hypothetical protein